MVLLLSALLHKVWRVVQTGYFQMFSPGHMKSSQVFHTSTQNRYKGDSLPSWQICWWLHTLAQHKT